MKKLLFIMLALSIMLNATFAKQLVVYSSRHYDVDKVIAQKFYQQTGIKIVYFNASSDILLSKIALGNEKFDLLVTSDVQTLYRAKQQGFLTQFNSKPINAIVPKLLKDDDNYFVGFTKRYRVIAYNNKKIKPADLQDYLSLGNAKFKNRVAIRSGNSSYNIFLVASFVERFGKNKALDIVSDMVKNLHAKPTGSDRDQLRIIAKGDADITVINSYYYGLMANSADKNDVAVLKNISLYFPNTKQMGAHYNTSSIGIAKSSVNVADATKFIEFLLTPEIQTLIMNSNYEHPVNSKVKLSPLLQSFGKVKDDNLKLSNIAKQIENAVKVIQDANWG